jgi:B12-binding domain/radical SAM domain protein
MFAKNLRKIIMSVSGSIRKVNLVFFHSQPNRYGINALTGAIDQSHLHEHVHLSFPKTFAELDSEVDRLGKLLTRSVVGFSFFTDQKASIYKAVQKVKERFPELTLIAGGPHPSAAPEEALAAGFDFVFSGEAENSLIEFLDRFIVRDKPEKTLGIAYLKNGELQLNPRPPRTNLDEFPAFSFKHQKISPIEITRGCPFGCYFCQTPRLFPGKVRHRSIERISEIVRKMYERGLKTIRFLSPNAFAYGSPDGKELNLDAIERLLQRTREYVRQEGRILFGTFPSEVRPEHVIPQTVELVCKYTNNEDIIIGAQSGSSEVLQACRRSHSVKDVEKAVELIHSNGLKTIVDFIFGFPGETEEQMWQSLKLMERIFPQNVSVHVHSFIPLPGTPFYTQDFTPIPKTVINQLQKYEREGLIFGDWIRQNSNRTNGVY